MTAKVKVASDLGIRLNSDLYSRNLKMELRLMYWKYKSIMVTSRGNEVKPTSPVHPFRILKGELEARGIKQKDFAERLGMKPSNFSRMINSDAELTPSLAIKLENELGIPYIHWMRMMGAYYKDGECV